jgi:hypothetical protein
MRSMVLCWSASPCAHPISPSFAGTFVSTFFPSLFCFSVLFCFDLFVLFSISHSALHVLPLYFGTCCLCLYLSRCVCKRVCVFSWIMSVLFPDEAFTSSPLSFCFVPSIFTCLLNPWAFFFGPPSWKCLFRFVSLVCPGASQRKTIPGGLCSCFVQGKETTALEWVREHVEYDLTMWPNGQITPKFVQRNIIVPFLAS